MGFGINQAVNRDVSKLSCDEIDISIHLIECILNNNDFDYDKTIFIQRLEQLKNAKEWRNK